MKRALVTASTQHKPKLLDCRQEGPIVEFEVR